MFDLKVCAKSVQYEKYETVYVAESLCWSGVWSVVGWCS